MILQGLLSPEFSGEIGVHIPAGPLIGRTVDAITAGQIGLTVGAITAPGPLNGLTVGAITAGQIGLAVGAITAPGPLNGLTVDAITAPGTRNLPSSDKRDLKDSPLISATREVRSVVKLLARDILLALSRTMAFWHSLPLFMSCFIFR